MQIVIDIPEGVKKAFDNANKEDIYGCYYDFNSVIGKAIKNGTPLPKGHGPIVDVKVLKAVLPIYVFRNEQGQFCKISDIDKIPPFAVVIEADKEGQE